MVQSGEACDARVATERMRIKAAGSATLGVIPTVSLGMAMLIFALVGTFAAGIALAFQGPDSLTILGLSHSLKIA